MSGKRNLINIDVRNPINRLTDLEVLLRCHLCHQLPDNVVVKRIRNCDHLICDRCAAIGFPGGGAGACPVQGCGVPGDSGDLLPDKDQMARIEAVLALKKTKFFMNLFSEQENQLSKANLKANEGQKAMKSIEKDSKAKNSNRDTIEIVENSEDMISKVQPLSKATEGQEKAQNNEGSGIQCFMDEDSEDFIKAIKARPAKKVQPSLKTYLKAKGQDNKATVDGNSKAIKRGLIEIEDEGSKAKKASNSKSRPLKANEGFPLEASEDCKAIEKFINEETKTMAKRPCRAKKSIDVAPKVKDPSKATEKANENSKATFDEGTDTKTKAKRPCRAKKSIDVTPKVMDPSKATEKANECSEELSIDEGPETIPKAKRASRAKKSMDGTAKVNNLSKADEGVKARRSTAKGPKKARESNEGQGNKAATKLNESGFKKPKATAAMIAKKSINKKNSKGETALHTACRRLEVEKVRSLLKEGAEVNTQDYAGWTPLHEVAQRSHLELVSLLLEHGVNPNIPGGEENVTPLHDAVQSGGIEVVKALIAAGANKEARDAAGHVPKDLASDEAMRQAIDEAKSEISEDALNSTIVEATTAEEIVVNVVGPFDEAFKSLCDVVEVKRSGLNKDLTHLVLKDETVTDDIRPAVYEALLSGAWILKSGWISRCLGMGKIQDEAQFLIPKLPTELARLNRIKRLPKLLDGTKIFLSGAFSAPYPDKDRLTEILRKGGAKILKREPDPEALEAEQRPYHAPSDGPLAKCSHFIIYQEGSKSEPLLKYNMAHLKTLPTSWLFECFDNFKIIDPFPFF